MKRIILAIAAFLVGLFYAHSENTLLTDTTTVVYKNKTIHIEDSVGKLKIQVYDSTETAYKKVYEGIFSDDKSYEKWTIKEDWGINLPFLKKVVKKKSKMEPHWGGFGWGFANISNNSFALNNIDGVSLKSELSNEFYFNPIEKILPVIGSSVGLTTGLGVSWRNYHLDMNQRLLEVNNVTGVYDAPPGITYTYSRMRLFAINVPLLLEFQHKLGSKRLFFVSAGVVGGVNTSSSYKLKYESSSGQQSSETSKGTLNIAPLTLDYMAQIGFGKWSVYGKYSPFDLFQAQKGPRVKAVSLGATFHF